MGKKTEKKCCAVLLIFVFLLQDPYLLRAGRLDAEPGFLGEEVWTESDFEQASEFAISYCLNGGIFPKGKRVNYTREDLPVEFEIPVREGYNFAGWYTDSSFLQKVSGIAAGQAGDYQLYAKWTKRIDGEYNVQMYPYRHIAASAGNTNKKLKDCRYSFLKNVKIPGMPYTRETDVRENRITDTSQSPQGLCMTDDYLLVSAYSGKSGGGLGCIHVFDRETGEYLVSIGVKKKSHMGGLAFDGKHIWVCHSGSRTLGRISYAFIQKAALEMPQSVVDCSGLFEEFPVENTPSCIAYQNGRIWVATHTKVFGSKMVAYRLTNQGLEKTETRRIPDKVQGIVFDEDGKVYVSTSYGRRKSSYLKVYESLEKMDKNPNKPMKKVEMPPCSEEIELSGEQIYVLFESAGEKYFEGTDGKGTSIAPVDEVLAISVQSVLE
ncbi:MAG: InlB B-repeat-containing protein [Eubacterium sp.]|nr:InlB B-repeat-containing protein [Eubacterium sp.]